MRREERRERDVERRALAELRARLAAVAPAADAWFRRWVRRGRFDLVRGARLDERRDRIELPAIHVRDEGGPVWAHDDPGRGLGRYRYYRFSLGVPHSLSGGLTGCRMGGPGGGLGTFRSLAELARKETKSDRGAGWPDIQSDVLRAGVLVARLLDDDGFEPWLVPSLRSEARHLASVVARR